MTAGMLYSELPVVGGNLEEEGRKVPLNRKFLSSSGGWSSGARGGRDICVFILSAEPKSGHGDKSSRALLLSSSVLWFPSDSLTERKRGSSNNCV